MNGLPVSFEEELQTLSPEKLDLLRILVQGKAPRKQHIKRASRELRDPNGTLPSSWSQQRLWFIDQLEGAGAAYHIPVAMRLRGALDDQALTRALDELIDRHEVLR